MTRSESEPRLFDAKEAFSKEYASAERKTIAQPRKRPRVFHELGELVRGQLTFSDRSLKSWIEAARTSHSTKPDTIRRLMERASPGPRLELFGRRTCPGWSVFGSEVQMMFL